MIVRPGLLLLLLALSASTASIAWGQPEGRTEFRATPAATAPIIDGALDDEVWQSEALPTGEFLTYDPLHGDPIPQKTTVWFAYDTDYLYVAFKCDDPDPSGIKTSITRRDNIFNDDWVGLSLDALGTGQLSYHMMVNPSGIQLDMLNSVAGNEDISPDWIWDSAGQLTETGYSVEIRLPLQSIRFKGGADARMGILFWRRVSRSGVSVAWPALAPGVWVFERHASLRFDNLAPRLAREILPSATYSRTELRESPSRWAPPDGRGDVGLSVKFGLASTITLDATVNPDFSQVESDSFQVEVNQRFPVFFGEKRPFFMEGAGVFSLAGTGGGDNTLRTAVHTRRIIDPIFGAKLTGSAGRMTFGTLTAVDEAAGRDVPLDSPGAGKNRLFNIARAQYSLGPSNYVGALVTDTSFAGSYNRVVGADFTFRLGEAQRVEAFALASRSRAGEGLDPSGGFGAQVNYNFSTKPWGVAGSFEHYDEDFEMATAFMNRVGVTGAWGYVERNLYPDSKKHPWIHRITLFSFSQGGRDRFAGGNEFVQVAGLRANFTRQGFLRVDYLAGFEHWAGQHFKRGRPRVIGEVQLYRWMSLEAFYGTGLAVFYDPEQPFQGWSREFSVGTTLQPSGRLSQNLKYQRVAFDRADTRVRVYDLDIVNSRTTYQFTRSFALRGIAQYDSSRKRVLTDFLSSYEPRPGTVVYAGYGSLLEQREFVDGVWVPGVGEYRTTQRGLFFKASYLYRF